MKVPLVWTSAIIMMMMPMVLLIAVEAADECGQETNEYDRVSFDVIKGANCYPNFLKRIRNKVEAPIRSCGFPSTRQVPLTGKQYLKVDLKFSNREWVTLGLDVKDLYIWGYQDKFQGALRSTFVNDTPDTARNSLFQDAVIKRTTTFKGNYGSLENFADIVKTTQALNVGGLKGALEQVYGKPESQLNNAIEAKFFLLVIQMVSEATRFKFIEDAIYDDKDDQSQYFKLKLSDYVNDWDKISKAIHRAQAQPIDKCTIINPPLVIGKGDATTVVNVKDLLDDMALLKYSETSPSFSQSYAVM